MSSGRAQHQHGSQNATLAESTAMVKELKAPSPTPSLSSQILNQLISSPQSAVRLGGEMRQEMLLRMGHMVGNQAVQRSFYRVQRNGDQAPNVYSERNYVRISNAQQQLIDRYAEQTHSAISAWGELRALHTTAGLNIGYDDYMQRMRAIKTELKRLHDQLGTDFMRTDTTFTQEVEMPIGPLVMPPAHQHQVSLGLHQMAQAEVARQLNRGFFPQYFREMMTLHPYEGANLVDLEIMMRRHAGLTISARPHVYQLKTRLSVEGGAGEGVSLGGSVKAFIIEYSNDLGMAWKVNTYGLSVKGGAGLSISPVEANVESSFGGNEIGTGTAREMRYYPPNYFRVNLVTGTSAGAGMGGGVSLSSLTFGDVRFDTSGVSLKFGTNVVGEVGADLSVGVFGGGSAYDQRGLVAAQAMDPQARGDQWQPYLASRVYFRTEEARLDGEDQRTLDQILEAILRHERLYPGDTFRITIKGFASEAWRTPEASARAYGVDTSELERERRLSGPERRTETARILNESLARNRSQVVNQALVDRILGRSAAFTPGVLDRSQVSATQFEVIHPDSPEHEENAPTDRYVQVGVFYNTTSQGNVLYNAAAGAPSAAR